MASDLPKITEPLSEKTGIVNRTWYRFLAKIERLIIGGATTAGTGLSTTASGALTIAANGVTNAMLAQGTALSIIGVAGNATANRGDIAAASSGMFLQRYGTTVSFKYPTMPPFSVTTAPVATSYPSGTIIYVYDEIGGATIAFSDGTNWRRVTDRAIIA